MHCAAAEVLTLACDTYNIYKLLQFKSYNKNYMTRNKCILLINRNLVRLDPSAVFNEDREGLIIAEPPSVNNDVDLIEQYGWMADFDEIDKQVTFTQLLLTKKN